MKTLRKSSLITVIFLGIWLLTAFSYSMQSECSCCYPKEYQRGCNEKRDIDQSSPSHKNQPIDNQHQQKDNHCRPADTHHQGEEQCDQKDNHCSCTHCVNSSPEEPLSSKVYCTGLEKKQVLILEQDISEGKILLPKGDIVAHLNKPPPLKFLSLFLLNASFLI